MKTEELDKTPNKMIFIERDTALSKEEISERMEILRKACDIQLKKLHCGLKRVKMERRGMNPVHDISLMKEYYKYCINIYRIM